MVSENRVRNAVEKCLGFCSVTQEPFRHLDFFLARQRQDPTWTPDELRSVEDVVRKVLYRMGRHPNFQ